MKTNNLLDRTLVQNPGYKDTQQSERQNSWTQNFNKEIGYINKEIQKLKKNQLDMKSTITEVKKTLEESVSD